MSEHYAVAYTIHEFARALDEKLFDTLLPTLFTPDAVNIYWQRGRRYDMSMPGGVKVYKEVLERCRWTQHHVSPHVLSIEGDRAKVRTPVHALHLQQRKDGTHNHWTMGTTYEDELVKIDGKWRICSRVSTCYYNLGDQLLKGVRLFPTVPSPEVEGA